jgi:hypothetical protein
MSRIAARDDSAASITARKSSIRCSGDGSADTLIGEARAAAIKQDQSREGSQAP